MDTQVGGIGEIIVGRTNGIIRWRQNAAGPGGRRRPRRRQRLWREWGRWHWNWRAEGPQRDRNSAVPLAGGNGWDVLRCWNGRAGPPRRRDDRRDRLWKKNPCSGFLNAHEC